MNQRVNRSKKGKGENNIGGSTINTGGHVAHHARGKETVVKTPQKATGDVPAKKLSGLAKASPFFEKVKEVVKPKTKAEEKQAIAKATEKDKTKKKDEDKDTK